MASLTKTQMLARLDIWLDDADDFAFTDAQKAEGYNSVVNDDPLVYQVVKDVTIPTTANTPTYTPAADYEAILAIAVDINGDGFPLPIDRGGWDFVDGTIRLNRVYKSLPAGKTIHLTAKKKLDADTDTIPTRLQAYVLHRATAGMLSILSSRKTGRFLRNDTTMTEILNKLSLHERKADLLGKKLSNRHDVIL